jgi:uncharacterized lipoprotein
MAFVLLAGCRGDAELKCETGGEYLSAAETPRVTAPEDLDDLDRVREVPLPEVSPQAERPEGSGCLESPPRIGGN